MAASCHHSELVSHNVPHIDNSEYELVNKQLSVTGVGESRNHQQAISKSRTAALDSAVTILSNLSMQLLRSVGLNLSVSRSCNSPIPV